jgi:hypothetical protein
MCLNEANSRAWEGKHLSNMFPIKNGFIQDALSSMLFSSALE